MEEVSEDRGGKELSVWQLGQRPKAEGCSQNGRLSQRDEEPLLSEKWSKL